MDPTNLIKGNLYQYRPNAQSEEIKVIYRYETLNYWFFETPNFGKQFYFNKQQVIYNISEI